MSKFFFIISLLSIFISISIFTPSCTSDKLDPVEQAGFCDTLNVTYDFQIKEIMATNCAYVGCHVSGFSDGDFSTYDGMLSRLNSGEIERRAVTLLDMPPPTSGELSPEDLDILNCWISKGYPE